MIINDLFDLDFYKLTMAQYAFVHGKDCWVKYEFIDRTKNSDLFGVIDFGQMLEEFAHVRHCTFNNVDKLKKFHIFSEDFLTFLKSIGKEVELPIVNCVRENNKVSITVEGFWPVVIFWETYILSIINELYYAEKRMRLFKKYGIGLDSQYVFGQEQLWKKITKINDECHDLNIAEFGTRRRFSKYWQEHVIKQLFKHEIIMGTSNVEQALKHSYPPFGTFAHELPMIVSGIHGKRSDAALYDSQNVAFDTWYNMYNGKLPSIALSDTFTSEHTFITFGKERAEKWDGFRHDSNDPFVFADKLLKKYGEWGIDATKKMLVFSDNLNVDLILELHEKYSEKIKCIFGWGTDLSNDVGMPNKLSIVVKATEVNGVPIVKLSDNPEKISGDPTAVQRYQKVFLNQ